MDRDEILKELALESEMVKRIEGNPLSLIIPNRRQKDFLNSLCHETMFAGLNQAGKSTALCIKATYHLTGRYPEDYTGPRFDHPISAAIGGETAQTTRDLLCDRLLGGAGHRGSGYIPRDSVEEKRIAKMSGGIPNQIDYFEVKHRNQDGVHDGWSKCFVFSYSTGWQRLQGYTLHWIGIDEEPPFGVYDEFSARLNATNGYMDLSLTPLQGETELYLMFEEDDGSNRTLINYDIMDTDHMTDADRERLIKKYLDHPLAEARLHGRPVRGEGLVYRTPDSLLSTPDFAIPDHWKKIIGLDFPHGTGYFAAVKIAINPEDDVAYLVSEYKEKDRETPIYAERVRLMGGLSVPVSWPHDGARTITDGSTIASKYRDYGINMLSSCAHLVTMEGKKTFAVMTIIEEVIDRMQSGRFRVFDSCLGWFKEKRRYKHDAGRIAKKQDDHLIDAMHKAVMMLRYADSEEGGYQLPARMPEFDFFA